MDAGIRSQWTAALRSGEYRQGQRQLRSTNPATGEVRYCCLGVLCELAVRAGVIEPAFSDHYGSEFSTLPRSVREWANLSPADNNPVVEWDGYSVSLAELNDGSPEFLDGQGLDFGQIADIIDTQL